MNNLFENEIKKHILKIQKIFRIILKLISGFNKDDKYKFCFYVLAKKTNTKHIVLLMIAQSKPLRYKSNRIGR